MTLVDIDKIKFGYGALAYIPTDDYENIARFFANQLREEPIVEAKPIVHAHWELRYENIENDDGWTHNRCSHCKHDAIFYPTFSEDWDEDIDGEWISLGVVEDGIEEFLTDYCPNCGTKMDEVSE